MAEEIIAEYKENPQSLNEGKLLLVFSNQKMNGYLKEMADVYAKKLDKKVNDDVKDLRNKFKTLTHETGSITTNRQSV